MKKALIEIISEMVCKENLYLLSLTKNYLNKTNFIYYSLLVNNILLSTKSQCKAKIIEKCASGIFNKQN